MEVRISSLSDRDLLASSSGHRSESFVYDRRKDLLIILSISMIVLVFVFRF
jgi:hypothetical protein